MSTMIETWKPVDGHPGYEVSDLGRVRSKTRTSVTKAGWSRVIQGRVLKPYVVSNNDGKQGALVVQLGRGARKKVGAMVLEAFVGPRLDGMVVCHYDDDHTNNRLSNLRWDTYSANMYDMVRNGNHPGAKRSQCKNGHVLVPSPWTNQRYCPICSRESAARRKQGVTR